MMTSPWINGGLGVLLLAITVFGYFYVQRKIRGDDTPLFGGRKRPGSEDDNEINAFIAAYQSGQGDPSDLLTGDTDVMQVVPAERSASDNSAQNATASGASVSDASGGASEKALVAEKSSEAGAFLRPEVKLAYLTFRSGLRDHHIFANALLRDLGYGTAVVGKVDLLICDSSFKYVALIDVFAGEPEEDIHKSVFLSRSGVKHLKLSVSAMPKPGELRELIYGEQAG